MPQYGCWSRQYMASLLPPPTVTLCVLPVAAFHLAALYSGFSLNDTSHVQWAMLSPSLAYMHPTAFSRQANAAIRVLVKAVHGITAPPPHCHSMCTACCCLSSSCALQRVFPCHAMLHPSNSRHCARGMQGQSPINVASPPPCI